jgi:transposase
MAVGFRLLVLNCSIHVETTTSLTDRAYRQWRLAGTWEKIHEVLRAQVRTAAGREATPSAAIIDSQRVKGRKRHLVVDTLGLLLAVVVHSAGIQDRDGARLVSNRSQVF